ncbi:hypothetical protein M3Y97_00831700 [Aphelenchoides bicaudatus]|nr:hypothetical protein M3Y97_00831700 [Aphelenchoides bicaudatus]
MQIASTFIQGNHLCVCKNGFIGGHPGFVLVGRKCEPITEQSIKSCHQDKSVCHLNAECLHDGTCLSGYIGDGVSVCAPSQTQPPNDQPAKIPAQEQTYISGPISIKPPSIAPPTSVPQKVNPPSIKPPSIAPPSIAPTTLETTETSKSYKMVTMPQHKVTIKTTTPEAYQTPPPPTTTTPETYQTLQTTKTVDTVGGYQKPDICSTLKCHQNAECINIEGAYKCSCHNGFYGDGHNCYRQEEVQPPLKVQCSADGMEVLLSEANKPFSGHVYVEGQKDNPYCSKTYSGQQASPTDQQPYKFFIPISHCNMKLENQNTLSATVIVQKHSTFITEQAYSYQVRCTYPLGVKLVDSKFDVKDLETATETAAVAQKLQPSCKIEVKNLENIVANSATVGQVMKLVLSVQPNETYGIRPRNCFAMNMETAERYRLTDEDGCAFDTDLFPQWTQLTKARTQSIFRTFKWPDCRMIRFECDCIPCLDKCPEIACSRKTYRAKRHLLHQKNSTTEADLNEQESNWMKNRVDGARRTAFSSVIYVREKQESEDAQREFEDWLVRDSKQDRRSTQTISSRLCFGDTWPLLIIVAGLLLLAVASILFLFHRLAQVQKDEKKRNLRHANSLGNLSAYIQF